MDEVKPYNNFLVLGWKEWLSFPDFSIPAIKAKIDTGATTSSIGTTHIREFKQNNEDWVEFKVSPISNVSKTKVICRAKIIDKRVVSDSGGHRKLRYVVRTTMKIGNYSWSIELTLANRNTMKFQVLLGREAMIGKIIVNPMLQFSQGKISPKNLKKIYEDV